MSGTIYGIGVGPGDPSLLTLRAVEILHAVSAVLVPKSTRERDSLALQIAQPHLPAACEVMEAVFPMTADRAVLEQAWQQAAALLLERANAGADVAFLTLGDAMLYSTWGYLLQAILVRQPAASVVSVPGITAMSACAAALGTPLAAGREPLLIWPDTPPAELSALRQLAPNLVFMKAARHLQSLAESAEKEHLSACAVRRCSLPDEQITTELSVWADDVDYFTTVLMHSEEQS